MLTTPYQCFKSMQETNVVWSSSLLEVSTVNINQKFGYNKVQRRY